MLGQNRVEPVGADANGRVQQGGDFGSLGCNETELRPGFARRYTHLLSRADLAIAENQAQFISLGRTCGQCVFIVHQAGQLERVPLLEVDPADRGFGHWPQRFRYVLLFHLVATLPLFLSKPQEDFCVGSNDNGHGALVLSELGDFVFFDQIEIDPRAQSRLGRRMHHALSIDFNILDQAVFLH